MDISDVYTPLKMKIYDSHSRIQTQDGRIRKRRMNHCHKYCSSAALTREDKMESLNQGTTCRFEFGSPVLRINIFFPQYSVGGACSVIVFQHLVLLHELVSKYREEGIKYHLTASFF